MKLNMKLVIFRASFGEDDVSEHNLFCIVLNESRHGNVSGIVSTSESGGVILWVNVVLIWIRDKEGYGVVF